MANLSQVLIQALTSSLGAEESSRNAAENFISGSSKQSGKCLQYYATVEELCNVVNCNVEGFGTALLQISLAQENDFGVRHIS